MTSYASSSTTLLMFEIDFNCIVSALFQVKGTNANDLKVTDLVDMKVVVLHMGSFLTYANY